MLLLQVVTQLVAYLQKSLLVFFDEPETLCILRWLRAFLKCLRNLLSQTS